LFVLILYIVVLLNENGYMLSTNFLDLIFISNAKCVVLRKERLFFIYHSLKKEKLNSSVTLILQKQEYNMSTEYTECSLKQVLEAWSVTWTFQYRPWTGSIKPSQQYFQFCSVELSLGILFFSILWSYQCYLYRVAAVKSLLVHLIKDVIFSFREDR
jgi:hypothetical protein